MRAAIVPSENLSRLLEERIVKLLASIVEAVDPNAHAGTGVVALDGVQGRHGGGVPDVGSGEVDDDGGRVAREIEGVDQLLVGGEEEITGD